MTVLLVEDEPNVVSVIKRGLADYGFDTSIATNGLTGLQMAADHTFDLIILDVMLPNMDGIQICKRIREHNQHVPILMLTALDSTENIVTGLNSGADDYLTKPFHLSELGARVAAIVRRKSFEGKTHITVGHLILDLSERILRSEEQQITLTRKEYELLLYFLSNKNKVVTKEAIVEHLWGDDIDMADSYDFIYSHIKNLRKKLMGAGCPDYIKAVYGMGYKFSLEN